MKISKTLLQLTLKILIPNINITRTSNINNETSISVRITNGAAYYADHRIQSIYSHQNSFSNGIYQVNCSGFVHLVLTSQNIINPIKEVIDYIPENFIPCILNNVPSPLHYVFFLEHKQNKQYWEQITNATLLKPGDFIVYTQDPIGNKLDLEEYRSKINSERGQHIMIVADSPKKTSTTSQILWVPIFDSTKNPHGLNDTRPKDGNGIGCGIIGLELDKHNNPDIVLWKNNSMQYKYRRNIKMARIIRR